MIARVCYMAKEPNGLRWFVAETDIPPEQWRWSNHHDGQAPNVRYHFSTPDEAEAREECERMNRHFQNQRQ
jgi:hypothetical protein